MKITLSLFYLLFFSLISYGQIFKKVSPTPTEVQYNDIAFADSLNVWVVGEEGTILHSSDRGEVWEVLPNITPVNLKKVFFLNPNIGWIVGGNDSIGVRLRTIDGGQTWAVDDAFPNRINDIFIHENGVGWMVGNEDFILKTTDSGATWMADSLTNEMNINRIYFLNEQIGWVAANKALWKTSDGGTTWQQQNGISGYNIKDVFFVNENYGWAVGSINVPIAPGYYVGLAVTEDGGENWSTHLPNIDLESVVYLNEEKGWIVGKNIFSPFMLPGHFGKVIYQTTNSNIPSSQDIDYSISKYNATFTGFTYKCVIEDRGEIWIVGGEGVILKKGINDDYWDCKTNVINNLFAVDYVTAEVAWAVGHRGFIVKSVDGGITWEEEPQFTNETLLDLIFINENIGYTVGSHGEIWKTIDGGDNWIQQVTDVSSYLKGVTFVDENIGWTVGSDGTILHTQNGGELWEIQYTDASSILNAVQMLDDKLGFVTGYPSVFLTTEDGGETWLQDSISYGNLVREYNFTDVNFLGERRGMVTFGHGFYDLIFAVDSFNTSDILYHSTFVFSTPDEGANWDLEIDSSLFGSFDFDPKGINSIEMFDLNNGIMAGRGVYIKNEDSLNWQKLDTPNEDILGTWQDIDCYNKNNCLVVGLKGNILKVENDYILADNNSNTVLTNIKVFPNPTDGKVTCQNLENIDQVRVFDFQGRLIKNIFLEKNTSTAEFTLNNLTLGIYLLNFIGKEKMQNAKVVLF